jgi:hypothetical protein
VELCELAANSGRAHPDSQPAHNRLSVDWGDKENRPPSPRYSGLAGNPDHWLDRLERGVKTHISAIEQKRDELAAMARPPQALFDAADPEAVRMGAGLNRAFAGALNRKRPPLTQFLPEGRKASQQGGNLTTAPRRAYS